jgi:N-6 DNA Methylase
VSTSLLRAPAFAAATDSLAWLGYGRDRIRKDHEIAVSASAQRWPVNIVAFSDSVCQIENACITVLDFRAANIGKEEAFNRLRHTTAPFHILYDERHNGFDVLAAKPESMRPLATMVSPDRLRECIRDYATDMQPSTVQRVKRGLSTFSHKDLVDIKPLQLLLWAEEANCALLAAHFKHALSELMELGISDNTVRSRIAAQLLTARILTDTGAMSECADVTALPAAAEDKHFSDYFDSELLTKNSGPAQAAYDLFRNLSYATFQPEMLRTLYKKLFTKEESRAKGRFDTPLWLTRLIWRQIPVEFIRPEQRRVVDLTCGWGSFLISTVERFSVLSDMKNRQLSRYVFGNDQDETTAQLARIALLTSTGRDSWQVGHEDGRKWNIPGGKKPGVIVGNPPFAGDRKTQQSSNTGGRRQELANEFLSRAVDMLADGGYLAMVMPGSFATSEAGPLIRKRMMDHCDIQEIWDLPGQVFEAGVQPLVIFARKVAKKDSPSLSAVRIRTCQRGQHLTSLKESGIFTRSTLVRSQAVWARDQNSAYFTYSALLDESEKTTFSRNTVRLGDIATVISGCIRGSQSRVRTRSTTPESVKFIESAGKALPSEFHLDTTQAKQILYPNDLEKPRLAYKDIFLAPKILMTSDPDPSWGKRVKIAIDRLGLFPSEGFIVIAPTSTSGALGLNGIAAILRSKVGNAWITESLRYRKISTKTVRSLPVPEILLQPTPLTQRLGVLLQRVEQRAALRTISSNCPQNKSDEEEIDIIVRNAYGIASNELWERLSAIYQWDTDHNHGRSFDEPPASTKANWKIQCAVESVDVEAGNLSLWVNGFNDRQIVPIAKSFPGWMLRTGAQFKTCITELEARRQKISGKNWGTIEPDQFTYLSDDEMTTKITAGLKGPSHE